MTPDELHWQTVKPLLKSVLTRLMESESFHPFRLVGGTSLSLQLGHRMSDDIDLFTDHTYGSVDFAGIDGFLRNTFSFVSGIGTGPIGLGLSYLIGDNNNDVVKLDLYYTDPFIQPVFEVGTLRFATVEEIIAMKVDVIQRKGRKKDFWDLHELLSRYTPTQMIALHALRYPYNHDEVLIRNNFTDFENADGDFNPVCLRGAFWELIKLDIFQAITSHPVP